MVYRFIDREAPDAVSAMMSLMSSIATISFMQLYPCSVTKLSSKETIEPEPRNVKGHLAPSGQRTGRNSPLINFEGSMYRFIRLAKPNQFGPGIIMIIKTMPCSSGNQCS